MMTMMMIMMTMTAQGGVAREAALLPASTQGATSRGAEEDAQLATEELERSWALRVADLERQVKEGRDLLAELAGQRADYASQKVAEVVGRCDQALASLTAKRY